MATLTTLREQLAAAEDIWAMAVTSTTNDGQSTSFDQEKLGRRIRSLRDQIKRCTGQPSDRPRAAQVNMRNFTP